MNRRGVGEAGTARADRIDPHPALSHPMENGQR